MLSIVPVQQLFTKLTRLLKATKVVRKLRTVLQGLELRLTARHGR